MSGEDDDVVSVASGTEWGASTTTGAGDTAVWFGGWALDKAATLVPGRIGCRVFPWAGHDGGESCICGSQGLVNGVGADVDGTAGGRRFDESGFDSIE